MCGNTKREHTVSATSFETHPKRTVEWMGRRMNRKQNENNKIEVVRIRVSIFEYYMFKILQKV